MSSSKCRRRWWLHSAVLGHPLAHPPLHSVQMSYSANNSPAALAFSHHIASTDSDAPSGQSSFMCRGMSACLRWRIWLFTKFSIFVDAVQCVLHKLTTVFKQVRTKLPTCARQIMKRVEVELGGELADYSVRLTRLAYIKAWIQVHAMAKAHG